MYTFTTSNLDLTSAPQVRSVGGWHISAAGTASVVQLRNGSASGAIFAEIKIPANTSVHFSAVKPLLFGSGVFVVPDANVSRGCIVGGS